MMAPSIHASSPNWFDVLNAVPSDLLAAHLCGATVRRIHSALDLTENDIWMLQHHSFANVLNQVGLSLHLLEHVMTSRDSVLSGSIALYESIIENKGDYTTVDWHWFIGQVREEIAVGMKHEDMSESNRNLCQHRIGIIENIFRILEIRLRESLEYHDRRDEFIPFSRQGIMEDIQTVFQVIAENSDGRYDIVFRPDDHTRKSYLLDVRIENDDPESPDTISFPPVFHDIFRDALANARKYSPVGSVIRGNIREQWDRIIISVSDSWYGIPTDQIDRLGAPWFRATNVQEREIDGHGYGFTKLQYYTERFRWVSFIRSVENVGTEVVLVLPKPGHTLSEIVP